MHIVQNLSIQIHIFFWLWRVHSFYKAKTKVHIDYMDIRGSYEIMFMHLILVIFFNSCNQNMHWLGIFCTVFWQSFSVITNRSERLSWALLLIPRTVWECAHKNSWPWGCHYWGWHCKDIAVVLKIRCHANGFRSQRNVSFYWLTNIISCFHLDSAYVNLYTHVYKCEREQGLMHCA